MKEPVHIVYREEDNWIIERKKSPRFIGRYEPSQLSLIEITHWIDHQPDPDNVQKLKAKAMAFLNKQIAIF